MAEQTDGEAEEVRFALDWTLEVEHAQARALSQALAPETDEHARLESGEDALSVEGEGSAGESLHTLDDVLACLTGAVEALDAAGDEE